MATIIEMTTIRAPSERVYKLVETVERYPQFIPDVRALRVLEADNCSRISWWHVVIEGVDFRWIERDDLDPASKIIRYKLIEGDLDKFEGMWRVEEDERASNVTLIIEYELGIPSFEEVLGPILHEKITMNARKLLAGIKQEAERDC